MNLAHLSTTWRLWKLLRHPPLANAAYQRIAGVLLTPRQPTRWQSALAGLALLILIFGGLTLFGVLSSELNLSLTVVLFGFVLINGLTHSLDWSVGIAEALAGEREQGRLELLRLTPPGTLGMLWAFAMGVLHRGESFDKRRRRQNNVLWVMLVTAGFSTLSILSVRSRDNELLPLNVALILGLLALIAAAQVDYLSSVVAGVLIGLLAPLLVARRTDAQIMATLGFLLTQAVVYLTTALLGWVVLPSIGRSLGLDGAQADLLFIVPRLLVFVLLREVVVIVLWRALLTQTEGDAPPATSPAEIIGL